MTAVIHPFPLPSPGKHDAHCDLVRANTVLAEKVLLAEQFAKQAHEYAKRHGDALLQQMMREFVEGMGR